MPVFLPQRLIQDECQPYTTLAELHRGVLGCHGHIIIAQPIHMFRIGLGELAISAERAREQAAAFGHSMDTEIQILMLHGLLHLMGLDHARDRGRMARIEKDWRLRLALPAGLIERTAK